MVKKEVRTVKAPISYKNKLESPIEEQFSEENEELDEELFDGLYSTSE